MTPTHLLLLALSLSVFARGEINSDKDMIPLKKKGGSVAAKPDDAGVMSGKGPKKDPSAPAPEEPNVTGMPQPYVASVETFGSSRINELILKETLGKDLDLWLKKGIKGDPSSVELEVRMADKMRKKFGFPLAEWSVVQYFEPGNLAVHITLDVVEKEDAAKRMNFLPAPTQEMRDPDGILKKWLEYEDTALELVETGQLEPESDTCVAFHCPFGHKHARLKKYEPIFVEAAKKNQTKLVEILKFDKNPDNRASAVYLLAYMKDGKKLISTLVDYIRDPDSVVRNNVLRVFGDIAEFHPELLIPVKPVLEALHFPRVSDRSKSLYVAYLLAGNSQHARDEILKSSVPDLLALLASKQPDHYELANGILRKISGKDFKADDVRSWTNWFNRLPKDRAAASK